MAATETGADAQAPRDVAMGTGSWARAKAILGGSAGNLVEWYDWFAYSSFALYFAPHFFPKGDQTAQLLQAAAVFAVGFLARPVGAWAMGLYADRAGRRTALMVAVLMMCVGSLVIALMPTYAQIGAFAPAGLLLARVLQGLSVGGEYGASATYMSEVAGKTRRGFWSSFQFVTMIMGQLVAIAILLLLQATLSPEDLDAWGWRIPFLIGGVMAVVVFWIRRGLKETKSYTASKEAGHERAHTMMLFRNHPRETAITFGLTAGGSLAFYAYTTYMQKFLVNTTGFAKTTATGIIAAGLVTFMLALPLIGWLSDKFSRKATLIFCFGCGAAFTYPLMSAISRVDNAFAAYLMVTALMIIISGYSAVSAAVKSELFPANVRALGVALPYATANAVFGGTAEYAALWFKQQNHENYFYIYVSVMMAVSLSIGLRLRNTNRTSLILED
ncbi:MFS transporter [Phenylobacterium sp.]|uniref:MFS transporter n=1 Tax=Phenylobacterium sp. TaxID=1871053 RepID=UPI003525912A